MVELFKTKKRRYGSPTLREEVKAGSMATNRKTVVETMRRQGLRAFPAKRFRHTGDSSRSLGAPLICLLRPQYQTH